MDTMKITKIVGAFCAALLFYKVAGVAAESLYHSGGGGHGEDHAATGYEIAVDGHGGGEEEAVVEVSIEEMIAAADVAKGERVFNKCKACHALEAGKNGTGPSLFGVVNADIGHVGDFAYSDALMGLDGVWDYAALNGFLTKPSAYAPGTKMGFSGLGKIEDRANLIAYLETVK